VPRVTTLTADVTGLGETVYLQRADLAGLSPATDYNYEIRLNGQIAPTSGVRTFRTNGAGAFRFLVLGDSGDDGAPQLQLAKSFVQESGSLFLHVGDIAYFEASFQQMADYFFAIYPELLSRIALFTAPGNHDYPNDAFTYRTLFSPSTDGVPASGQGRYYSFDWGNAHFVAVDTNASLTAIDQGDRSMLDWLDKDLQGTRQIWRIVYFHHTPFPSSDSKRGDPVCAMVLKYIVPVLDKHAVHLVLSGHEHIYQRTKFRRGGQFFGSGPGTLYVTTGGGGSQFYDPGRADFIAASASGSHFVRIDVGANTLTGQAVRPFGEILDQWSISATPLLGDPPAVDAASFTAGPAPGALVSLYGWNLATGDASAAALPLPTQLSGTQVLVDGAAVPLLFASRTQLNAQLPFDLSAKPSIEVRSSGGSASSAFTPRAVGPAIFLLRLNGDSLPAAVHVDGRLVDAANPAASGEWISVFLTGLGRVKGVATPGLPAPSSPLLETQAVVTARVGGLPAQVAIACLAPGFTGLYQVNLRIPTGLQPGAWRLQIFADGQGSNTPDLPVR